MPHCGWTGDQYKARIRQEAVDGKSVWWNVCPRNECWEHVHTWEYCPWEVFDENDTDYIGEIKCPYCGSRYDPAEQGEPPILDEHEWECDECGNISELESDVCVYYTTRKKDRRITVARNTRNSWEINTKSVEKLCK